VAENYFDDSKFSLVLEQHYWTLRNTHAERVTRQMFLLMFPTSTYARQHNDFYINPLYKKSVCKKLTGKKILN